MRPAPRIKFIWGASKVIQGRWYAGLFGFYVRVEGVPDSGLAISMRGLLSWMGVMAVLGYVALASALFWLWQKNPYSLLSYTDALFYPVRRAEITEKKGRAFIAQGLELFREKKFHDAANLLRLGLARYPHDADGRATLAQYYLLANQRPLAVRVLQEGLGEKYPGRAYLQTLLTAAEQAEDFALAVEVSGRYLQHVQRDGPETDARWLMERQFAALSNAGRHAEALALVEGAPASELTTEHRIVALLALNRPQDALRILLAWAETPGVNRGTIVRLKVRVHREARQFDAMEKALAEMRALAPGDPNPLVFGVVQQAMAGRTTEARAAFDDYVFRFGGDVGNLVRVAEPLAQIHDVALLERCVGAAKERGYPLQRFHSFLVEALVHRGQWDAARRVMAGMQPTVGRDAAIADLWKQWMHLVLEVAQTPSEATQFALVDFLRQRPWPAHVFRKTVEALKVAQRPETARDVLVLAERAFPASGWFRSEAARVNEELAGQAATRATEVVVGGGSKTGAESLEEKPFWESLDALVAARQWGEAARHIREARAARPTPAWLATRDAALRLVQVRVSHGIGDTNGMLAATRLFLNGDEVRAQQILDAANEFATAGDRAAAISLVKEVLRRTPEFAPAQKLMTQLVPPAKKEVEGK